MRISESRTTMSLPRISIITSTYNRAELLRRAIRSVVNQDYAEWEMCVVGDRTPDHSEDVVASFGDERLRFFNLPEKSPPGSHGAVAKNYAIQHMARGEYLTYLDDDDEYLPRFLSTMLASAEAHRDCPLVYCRAVYRDKNTGRRILGNPFQGWINRWSRENLMRFNFLVSNGVLHTRGILDEVGGWNPGDYFDDYDLWKRIAAKHDFYYVNKRLCVVYTEAEPFVKRAFTKGLRILREGRRLENQG